MVSKKTARCLAYGIAMGALTLAPAVNAQDTIVSGGAMGGSMMTTQPMQITGQVLRYYVDRSGYVTAMDVQTANGVQMVRFAPGMGQRIYSTYPVGGQTSLWVSGSPDALGTTYYNVVGMGDRMPAAGFMAPYLVSDVDLLRSEPYIMIGSRMVQFSGTLRSVVTDNAGEVLGLVLDNVDSHAVVGLPAAANVAMTGDAMLGGGVGTGLLTGVLVRVPREMRHPDEGAMGGSSRATALFPGADVEVVGYPEAPRYGVISNYGQRIAASALVVNGRAVGAVGMPKLSMERSRTLVNLNIGPDATEEERRARQMGYSTYDPTGGANSMSGTVPNAGGANTGAVPVQ